MKCSNALVQAEPAAALDLAGQFAGFGIVKGKPFHPGEREQRCRLLPRYEIKLEQSAVRRRLGGYQFMDPAPEITKETGNLGGPEPHHPR